ncbi:MAG: DUF5071 domain-containing protein [Thermonemataceae bacterium]
MEPNDYVYILQALQAWLDDLTRQKPSLDGETELLLVQGINLYERLWNNYTQMYNPQSNMVAPAQLRWEKWEEVPSIPDDIPFPVNKSDTEAAEALMQLPYKTLAPYLPNLLTWLQDVNWPVAQVIVQPLRLLKAALTPALLMALKSARKMQDAIWTFNLVEQLIVDLPTESIQILERELMYWIHGPDEELNVEILCLLAQHQVGNPTIVQRWIANKTAAYQEFIVALEKASQPTK